ncbi:tRNA (N6-threonylcarbamoyladenosine(37)-N6)-methyltransferase TrmO [Photobacterium indicum]|jgi:tRNA (adenine37-N6)-methyltransferase|uniref:tRNA (N6-threonylcarbamoyladenosine(37)-N6)-methyltransferase TrmO n=1 Tax=Photobacterium indicum TaxID=81447 RepID=A0A2T3L1K7_9GAMM|nr:tRNA (N6-threonylcarbamoyladenosine(37)-N6)-methyltransferase TrmO [Photobacterium indicum]PSV42381.1 tRNA (N6-threonylcarbamoyladenosine(37)-N6)-methyltransferase TrmO [Photobacterium indicum]
MSYSIEPIGIVRSPYKEKFAVPRQPGLVPSACSEIILQGSANTIEAVRGIEQFSHLWLLFLFDQNLEAGWRPTVRPPRLGGNERIGVFASRATFRPNGIGMSAVELKGIRQKGSDIIIELGGVDLVDGTPIIDIKPYVPYSDSLPQALGGFAAGEPETLPVMFTDTALEQLKMDDNAYQQTVISEVLAQDPRPAYKKNKIDTKEYAVHLFNFNVKFTVQDGLVTVTTIETTVE